ncbi:substrate-binding periplasmic protein [Ferrovibrio sp.]|uniref:substrate-binding periplasmic protein n=1 Tax=Ferrovibrio sp. TaxID=1917215 RepID=UPI003D10C0AA
MTRRLRFLCVMLAGLFAAAAVAAQTRPPAAGIPAAPESVVMGMGAFPPYLVYGDGGPSGLAVSLANELFPEIGLRLVLRDMPFARAMQEARSGGVEGMLLAAPLPEREAFLAFTPPVFCEYRDLFVRRGEEFDWRQTIAGKTIGVGQGLNYGPMFQSWIDARLITPVPLSNMPQLLEVLARGRFDAALISRSEADALMSAQPELRRLVVPLVPHITVAPLSFAFARSHDGAARAARLTAVLRQRGLVKDCAL